MFQRLLKDKTTDFQHKRQAAPAGIQTKSIRQLRKEAKKKLGMTETEAEFKRRLQKIRESLALMRNP